jgi:hypothetical protein
MFSAIRKRLRVSPATVIAGLALVFAMTGGAYAAKKYLITSTRQISPSVLKALQSRAGAVGAQGPAGAAGPQGLAGLAGAKGETGAAGKDGAQGREGKEGPSGPKGAAGATGAAGAKGVTGPAGGTGPEGVCSTASCSLPANVTETGSFYAPITRELEVEPGFTILDGGDSISFSIPLAHGLGEHNVIVVQKGVTPPSECQNASHAGSAGPANPEAMSGFLCVYVAEAPTNGLVAVENSATAGLAGSEASVAGAFVFVFEATALGQEFWGTWAVTG